MMKEKITLEYSMNKVSQKRLWKYVGTALGLEEWFADKVTFDSNKQTADFEWDGELYAANILSAKELSKFELSWTEDEELPYYFSFEIERHDISKETTLVITDYVDTAELDDAQLLWDKQIETLKRRLGLF